MRRFILAISFAMLLVSFFLCGCESEVGVTLIKIDRNNPEFHFIIESQFREYSTSIQWALLNNGTTSITKNETNNFISTSGIIPNKILFCDDLEVNVFEGYINYANNTYYTFFKCDPISHFNLTLTFIILESVAINISEQNLMNLPAFARLLHFNITSGSLPRDEWDILWKLVDNNELSYLKYNNIFYQINFITT
jgi:hypothetical protein